MAADEDHICFPSELCALISMLWIRDRPVQTHAMPSLNVVSAKEAERDATERRVVERSAESGPLSFSAPEGSEQGEELGRSGSVGGGRNLLNGEVTGNESRRCGCREQDTAVSFAKRSEIPSESGSSRRVHGRVTHTEKTFPWL